MPDSIPGSSKIFTLATAPFLFILVGVLHFYQFAMVPEVYVLLCARKKRYTLLPEGNRYSYTFSWSIIKKI